MTGPHDGAALLLLQGQANHQGWWNRLRSDFDDHWLTVTFDYRGTGRTVSPESDNSAKWSTASFAEDAVAVLRAIGRSDADVYGTSMGGRVAQEFAIRHPDVVRRLVLACTSPGGVRAVERGPEVRRELAVSDPVERSRVLARYFYTDEWVQALGDTLPHDLFGDPAISAGDARKHLNLSDGHNAFDRLHHIASPALILHGEDDQMSPVTNAHIIASQIQGSRTVTIPRGRHGFFDEMRDVVAPQIRRFLMTPTAAGCPAYQSPAR